MEGTYTVDRKCSLERFVKKEEINTNITAGLHNEIIFFNFYWLKTYYTMHLL